MAERFLTLPLAERSEVLAVAADASGRPDYLLEKDVWVVWALAALFESSFGDDLCFKGGTSLSKAYRVIERFSEDVDITYDVRRILSGRIGNATADPLPRTRNEERSWTREVRQRLPAWVERMALPEIRERIDAEALPATARVDADRLILDYDSAASSTSAYVSSNILIEFGARATGEPLGKMQVVSDAAAHLTALTFPTASPRVMAAERTFWEKATAAHAFCLEERMRGERFARHWYDLVRLDEAGIAARALADRQLAARVVEHKNWFFAVRAAGGGKIDYRDAIRCGLRLVPEGAPRAELERDYSAMTVAGLLETAAPPFDEIMGRCAEIERRANRTAV